MRLELTVKNPTLTVHEGLQVGLGLVNDSAQSYQLPGPYDLTDALSIEIYRPAGVLYRRLNGFSRQNMMSSGRLDPTVTLDELPAGGQWRWDLELAAYHYPLPAGEFTLRAVYSVPEDSLLLRSADVPVHVAPATVTAIACLCDAPVLDGMTLLLRSQGTGAEPVTVLRQHNAQRPLAAWYSRRIDSQGGTAPSCNGPLPPFFAAARFFTTDSFEPTFVKWIVSTDGAQVFAHRLFRGTLDPVPLAALLPAGRTLLPSAYYDEDERLTIFCQQPSGVIAAFDLSPSGLRLLFQHEVPPTAVPPAVRADCDFIHILTPWQGAIYDRLTLTGEPRERKKPFTTRMPAALCNIDPVHRRGQMLFRDGAHGRAMQLVTFEPRRHRTDVLTLDQLPLAGEIRELAFDQDESGRFHLLASTSKRKLYYLRNGRGPHLIAQGEARFFPIVHADTGLYLGCQSAMHGYRFLYYRQQAHRHRIADFEESP